MHNHQRSILYDKQALQHMMNKSGITAYNIVELNKQLHQGGILHLTSLARKKNLSLLAVEKVHQYPVASPALHNPRKDFLQPIKPYSALLVTRTAQKR